MRLTWSPVLDCFDEELGIDTNWIAEVNNEDYGRFIWISLTPDDKYNIEYLDENKDFVLVHTSPTLKAAKSYVARLLR